MSVQFEIRSWMKIAEVDDWKHGCLPETARFSVFDYPVAAATPEALRTAVSAMFVAEVESVELDACDEPGRVDCCVMETDEGIFASPSEIARWRAGRQRLWYVTYTGHAESVKRDTISLTA